ncbi:MAG: DUF4276 family protein [Kiritimatiellia bacterium]
MSEFVFLLEEASAEAMLSGLLPRLLTEGTVFRFIVFEGKRDLDNQLERRLRGYRVPGARFVVLRDQDASDCREVKASLLEKCRAAGKANTLVRIACHELESWYLADLSAVERGLEISGLASQQAKKKYRESDGVANAAEELEKVTSHRYQKVGGSRAIGPHLDLNNTRSRSFAVFVEGIRRLLAEG